MKKHWKRVNGKEGGGDIKDSGGGGAKDEVLNDLSVDIGKRFFAWGRGRVWNLKNKLSN